MSSILNHIGKKNRGRETQSRNKHHAAHGPRERLVVIKIESPYNSYPTNLGNNQYCIDIFPADSDKEAVRVELFDDKLENISFFDPLTLKVTKQVQRVTVYPKTHYATPRQTILDAVEFIKVELK